MERLEAHLSPERVEQLRRLLRHPAAGSGRVALVAALDRHTSRLRDESLGAPVDLGLLDRLDHRLRVLLDDHFEGEPELVEAAVRYFAWTGDGDLDTGPDGLRDDARVADAVTRVLGRTDLAPLLAAR